MGSNPIARFLVRTEVLRCPWLARAFSGLSLSVRFIRRLDSTLGSRSEGTGEQTGCLDRDG